ncbi:MAG: peptidoglycan DD-metalloendopeptidase family protein [Ruminococcus sp.]|nr:peptidoglycan DD-metalloendopeptidase family protein [Ruminococcus sp.]
MGIFHNAADAVTSLFVRAAHCTFKFIAAILLAVIKTLSFIAAELWDMLKAIGGSILWLWREFTESFRSRVKLSNELTRKVRKAKKEGKREYITALLNFAGSFFFGENGVIYTAFNYTLPILCIAFLVGVVRFGSGLEYGIAVEYNGHEIGIISAEADFDSAARDVQQRVAYSDNGEALDMSAKLSLRVISDDDKFITAGQLADKMLEASDEDLTEAYGIYIDGSFVGAVSNKKAVEDALEDRLLNYEVKGTVRDVSYVNKIEYTKGIYLRNSVKSEDETIAQLTSKKEKKRVYVAQTGDNVVSVAQKYGMELEKFNELNPDVSTTLKDGQMINVIQTESFLPIQYVREMDTLSFLEYETIEVETSALNVGVVATLTKGERGEKESKIEITYVDGIEASRKVISNNITKNPVMEVIGYGTYSAMPDDPDTCFFGQPLTGTGELGWPLDGGWVSDTFISDRNHKGLDIAAPEGTEIYAAEEGQVVSAGWNSGGYGNVVMIEHPNGYATVYGHMISVYAVEGEYVQKGQLIGFVGNTGNSFGDHCHFEVRYQGICYDPASFLNTENMAEEKKKRDEERE